MASPNNEADLVNQRGNQFGDVAMGYPELGLYLNTDLDMDLHASRPPNRSEHQAALHHPGEEANVARSLFGTLLCLRSLA
jgi:hypothetical protein